MTDLSQDARWLRFHDRNWTCPCCGLGFSGVFDHGCDHPDPWPHGDLRGSGKDLLRVGDDALSADLCCLGEDRFIRAIMPIPIRGSDRFFNFGVWGSAHPDQFDAYVRAWHDDRPEDFAGCFSWLCNALAGFPGADPIACDLHPAPRGQRPNLMTHAPSALHDAQTEGISFDALLDIYAAPGTDIRPHLGAP